VVAAVHTARRLVVQYGAVAVGRAGSGRQEHPFLVALAERPALLERRPAAVAGGVKQVRLGASL
jgi:hypothetical protein